MHHIYKKKCARLLWLTWPRQLGSYSRTVDREDKGSSPAIAVWKFVQLCLPHVVCVFGGGGNGDTCSVGSLYASSSPERRQLSIIS